jgi:hypothetical protein
MGFWMFGFLDQSTARRTSLLPIAKRPAEPRTGTVVAAGEIGRRLVVPVAIERDIPGEVAEELDVIGRIHIEVNAPGHRNGRENIWALKSSGGF